MWRRDCRNVASLPRVRAPAGEATALAYRSEAFLGVRALILRCHDQQFVAHLDPFPASGIEAVARLE